MRKILLTSALVLAFVASTHAGDMQFPIATPPPPPTAPSAGEMQNGAPELIQVVMTLLGLF